MKPMQLQWCATTPAAFARRAGISISGPPSGGPENLV